MSKNNFIELLERKRVSYSIDGDKIFVAENLYLLDTSITSLPDNLSVSGWLDLSYANIISLPDNLSVGEDLDLSYTNITSLPENVTAPRPHGHRYLHIFCNICYYVAA